MRLSPTICHIGIVGAVVRTGRIPHPRNLFPGPSINCGKICIAVGPGVDLGNFQPVRSIHPLRVNFGATYDGDLSGETPQRIALRDRTGGVDRRSHHRSGCSVIFVAGDDDIGASWKRTA